MYPFLRRLMERLGRRKRAQIIVFDGAAELEKAGAFAKGAVTGILVSTILLAITAPTHMSTDLLEEVARRETLLQESTFRADQAMQVADVCLSTAHNLERTLAAYQSFLGGTPGGPGLPPSLLPQTVR